MEDMFLIVLDEGKPVFHLVSNLVLIINPAGQDLAAQGCLDEFPTEAADETALFTAPLIGDIGLELTTFGTYRHGWADG